MSPGLLPRDVLLDLVAEKSPQLRGSNTGGIDGRVTYCPVTLSSTLRPPIHPGKVRPLTRHEGEGNLPLPTEPISPKSRPHLNPFLLLSEKWCENWIRHDIKVLVLLQRRLSLADNVPIRQVKKYFFIASGSRAVSELQSSWLSQLVPNHSTFQDIISANLQCHADFSDHPLGKKELSPGAGWDGPPSPQQ